MIHFRSISIVIVSSSLIHLHAQVPGTIQHDGITRDHIIYVPGSYQPGEPTPLVLVLHGFTQSAELIMDVTGFNAVAEANDLIVVYPNGISNAWNTNSGATGGSTADDLGYLAALIDSIFSTYSIDQARVYSCGFSAGGYMSHRLACESPRCFAAIASVAGTMSTGAADACAPAHPTAIMQIHGTSDAIVPYTGSAFSGISVDELVAQWQDQLNCAENPQVELLPDMDSNDASTVERSIFSPCDDGSELVLLKVIGGGHQWPGTTALFGGIGTINRDIDASEQIWEFFENFACDASTDIAMHSAVNKMNVWPNPITDHLWVKGHSPNSPYEVIDAAGRIIRHGLLSDRIMMINLNDIDQGIYILQIQDASASAVRFVKQ